MDPIHFDVAHLLVVLFFIARDADGRISINVRKDVFSSGRAGILLPKFDPDSLAEQPEAP